MIDLRPLYKYDNKKYKLAELSKLQQQLLAGRLNDKNIKYYNDNPELVYKTNITIDKVFSLASDLPDADRIIDLFHTKKEIPKDAHICLISDFDTDGISSCVVLEKSLSILGYTNVSTIVNKRKYGTGVTSYCLDRLKEINDRQTVELIILSDHGSSNGPEYNLIQNELIPNVKIILTDHHQVNLNLMNIDSKNKNNFYFVNPQLPSAYTFISNVLLKQLSGCAIAYLTMLLIAGKDEYKKLEPLVYLVGMSTISDVMPLDNPFNRYFVRNGLKIIGLHWPKLLIDTLQTLKVTPKDLSFYVIPTINTGNRSDREDLAYRYVKDDREAVKELEEINLLRKAETKKIYKELLEKAKEINLLNTVICILDTPFNIAGNVASKIGEHFHKPTLIFNNSSSDTLAGSFRGIIEGVNGEEVLRKIEQEDKTILIRYGGHKMACGCTIFKNKLDKFKELFDEYIGEQIANIDIVKHIYIDKYIPAKELNLNLYKSTEIIGPYGKDWEDPVFMSRLRVSMIIPMGDLSKIIFRSHQRTISGFYPFPKYTIDHLVGYDIYVIYNLEMNVRNRFNQLGLRVIKLLNTDTDIDLIKRR